MISSIRRQGLPGLRRYTVSTEGALALSLQHRKVALNPRVLELVKRTGEAGEAREALESLSGQPAGESGSERLRQLAEIGAARVIELQRPASNR